MVFNKLQLLQLIKELHLDPIYGANTHVHADHVTGTGELKRIFPKMQSVLSKFSGGKADVLVDDRELLKFGKNSLEVRTTPGHTDGNSKTLYKSIHEKIFTLPDDFLLYPGHDYKGLLQTSVGEEKKYNPRLTKSLDEFVEIMKNLKLAYPKQIDKSLPANKVCGVFELMDEETRAKVKSGSS
ncbi:unnamed protein product [Gongylonema pulchrum]|uniref:Lactamase_B domain-containing protein n=1 Tax=Gongylonema pulchrum TaxID=637853 RepID=A0A183D1C1_9BILA|nr:unnamed protein product [Gongylonema pulchrum]